MDIPTKQAFGEVTAVRDRTFETTNVASVANSMSLVVAGIWLHDDIVKLVDAFLSLPFEFFILGKGSSIIRPFAALWSFNLVVVMLQAWHHPIPFFSMVS